MKTNTEKKKKSGLLSRPEPLSKPQPIDPLEVVMQSGKVFSFSGTTEGFKAMADDALIRWEKERREQLGSAITFLFGMSSGSLAFCASLITLDSIKFGNGKTVCFLIAVVCFVLTLMASIAATLTRLSDARTTADIVRSRNDDQAEAKVETLRSRAQCLSKCTWTLLYVQLGAFFVGAVFLLISLYLIFSAKF